jgi:hypothetical protein
MNEADIITAALAGLAPLGLKATQQKGRVRAVRADADTFARIAKGKVQVDVVIAVKRNPTPATLGAMLAQANAYALAHDKPVVIVTDYVTQPVADRLRAAQQQFIDLAGNAYLEAPGWLVYVVGRKPVMTGAPKHAAKGVTPAGLKVGFALLCDPTLANAPQRTIALVAGVALGAVPAILADMRDAGQLMVVGKVRRVQANKRMLDEWAITYARTLRPKTLTATYTTQNFADWKTWPLNTKQVKWGGEPAAALLTGYLRPGVLTLYTEKLPARLIHDQRLIRAHVLADTALVEIRKPFWGEALTLRDGHSAVVKTMYEETVPPVLIYADLLATGDARCIETAEKLYDEHLAQFLPAA